MIELSLVIPVMNEENNIQPLLEAVQSALNNLNYEVILVDDGSVDNTRKMILTYADAKTSFGRTKGKLWPKYCHGRRY